MLLQPIDCFIMAWLLLAGLSTLYLGIDQYRNNPKQVVMKWGFILVTLYMAPPGIAAVTADGPQFGNSATTISFMLN